MNARRDAPSSLSLVQDLAIALLLAPLLALFLSTPAPRPTRAEVLTTSTVDPANEASNLILKPAGLPLNHGDAVRSTRLVAATTVPGEIRRIGRPASPMASAAFAQEQIAYPGDVLAPQEWAALVLGGISFATLLVIYLLRRPLMTHAHRLAGTLATGQGQAALRYGSAAAVILSVLAFKFLVNPASDELAFLLLLAVFVSGAFGGLGPGFLAAALAALVNGVALAETSAPDDLDAGGAILRQAAFIVGNGIIAYWGAALHATRRHAFWGTSPPRPAPREAAMHQPGPPLDWERVQATLAAARALALLGEVSTRLARAPDARSVATELAQRLVPEVADWCTVDLLDANGSPQRLAAAHVRPEQAAWLASPAGRQATVALAERIARRVLTNGQPEVYSAESHGSSTTPVAPNDSVAALGVPGTSSAVVAPLLARGHVIGAIALGVGTNNRHLGSEDFVLAQALGGQLGLLAETERLSHQASDLRARYRSVLDEADNAMLLVDAAGRYIDANPAATALLGYSREEFLRLRIGDLPAFGPSWTEAERARFVREGRWRGQMVLPRKDGSPVRAEVQVIAVVLPGDTIYLTTLRPAVPSEDPAGRPGLRGSAPRL